MRRYRPMMERYLQSRFPVVDFEEVVSETLIALVDVLKDYRYSPEETGSFHNYLTGILRHKALRFCQRAARQSDIRKRAAEDFAISADDSSSEDEYRAALFEVAVRQFFDDETIAPRTKEIFRRTAIKGESPEAVAKSFMVERHTVDQIKSRSVAKLRTIIAALEKADD